MHLLPRLLLEGLALGLASGTACLATCVPVLLPYLLAGEGKPRSSLVSVTEFLLGRLAGYLVFGVLAWLAGLTLLADPWRRAVLTGVAYLVLAVVLIVFGFGEQRAPCAAEPSAGALARLGSRWPDLVPAALGLLTGVSLCPPFLLALTRGADAGGLAGSLAFFAAFFVGTSLYLAPLPLVGFMRRPATVRTVARLAAGVVGVYFAYLGTVALLGGLH